MISKKNIRYEGILYSINETNSTLALQNATSFGTEGREKTDPATSFVAPQEGIHAYLLFRGCDIKDLHVHEQEQETTASQAAVKEPESQSIAAPASKTTPTPQTTKKTEKVEDEKQKDLPPPPFVPDTSKTTTTKENESNGISKKERPASASNNGNSQRRSNPRKNTAAVGTGASLLNRKARGAVQGGACRFRRIN